MPNVSVGRGKCGEERDSDDNAAHFAVANVIASDASAGLTAKIGVVEQRCDVSGQKPKCQPVLCHPMHEVAPYPPT